MDLPRFDFVIVDECHHLGAETYERCLDLSVSGRRADPSSRSNRDAVAPDGRAWTTDSGAQLRASTWFSGLKSGFLANVDYRMYTDNVDWEALRDLQGIDSRPGQSIVRYSSISGMTRWLIAPRKLGQSWIRAARGIVFCGTVAHAEKDR